MAERTVLTSDELAFINKLMTRAASGTGERASGFHLDGGPQSNELLLELATHAELSLEAKTADFRLSFPVQLKEDEFHSLHLHLAPPVIFERGPITRAWRLQLEQPLSLLKSDGGKSPLRVRELSSHGLLVDAGNARVPKHFHLRLALPDDAPLEIDAHRVREVKNGVAAYEVEFSGEKDAERIRSFLYRQHKRLHPEAQAESSADLV